MKRLINMEERIATAIATCDKYNFWDRTVMPYGFKITVRDFLEPMKDYEHYTYSSKQVMQSELEGFEEILEAWVKVEKEPIIAIRLLEGKMKGQIKQYHKSTADFFIETGVAELA